MTKLQKSERDKYILKLRETLRPGDTLYTLLRSVSRSGMSRVIDVYQFETQPDGTVIKWWLSYQIAKACGLAFSTGRPEGIKMGGCGMDMGFEIVYTLGRTLWPNGFGLKCSQCGRVPVKGEDPMKRDSKCDRGHVFRGSNGDTTGWESNGGYALKQEWI